MNEAKEAKRERIRDLEEQLRLGQRAAAASHPSLYAQQPQQHNPIVGRREEADVGIDLPALPPLDVPNFDFTQTK